MNKRWLGWIGGGVVLALIAGGVMWAGGRVSPPEPVPPARAATPDAAPEAAVAELAFAAAEVVRPERAALPDRIEIAGPLVAPQTAVLRARVGAPLLALHVAEGERVRPGQVLARLDLAEAESRAAERVAQVEAMRAALLQAERSHAGNSGLAQQNFISPLALQASQSAVDTAQAGLRAAEAALAAARVPLREATLVAPIAGIVAKRHALVGERLSPDQPVFTLVNLQQLELAGSVGTHAVARLRTGLQAQVQVEGAGASTVGQLDRIAPAAEAGTRSIGVTIVLANADERLRAGQYAVAQVELPDDTERLVLPTSAIVPAAGEGSAASVWLIEDGVLAQRSVRLGRRDPAGSRIEVLDGVDEHSAVLAARFDNLREGARAAVRDAPLPAAPTESLPLAEPPSVRVTTAAAEPG
jgi:membrane fusion protein, multidrug efflux system